MCQLNLVFIKNSTNKKILKNEEYEYFGEKYKEFSPYIKGYCNCGSFVGSMSEYDGKSYLEMLENIITEELKKLQKIKEFMNKPDYKNQKEKYVTEKEKLSNMLEKFFEPLTNIDNKKGNKYQRYKNRRFGIS